MPPSRERKKGPRDWAHTTRKGHENRRCVADDHSLPLAVSVESGAPHESQLVEGSSRTASSTSSPND